MNRHWLEQESEQWARDGIIDEHQRAQILKRYPETNDSSKLLPYLGGIAVGLGIIAFAAANWGQLAVTLRLLIIVVAVLGFQIAGEFEHRKRNITLSTVWNGLGILSFGTGLLLAHDMVSVFSNWSVILLAWSVAAAFSAWWYQQRYLYVLFILIATGTQMYITAVTGNFHWFNFLLLTGIACYATALIRQAWFTFTASFAVLVQCWILLAELEAPVYWVIFPVLVIYTIGELVTGFTWLKSVQSAALTGGFIWNAASMIFTNFRSPSLSWQASETVFTILFAVTIAVSFMLKYRRKALYTAYEWMLFLPMHLIYIGLALLSVDQTGEILVFLYILMMFAYSLFVLWRGFKEKSSYMINLAVWLFLISSFFGYLVLNWEFWKKSILFLVLGTGLLAANFYIQRKKKSLLKSDDDK